MWDMLYWTIPEHRCMLALYLISEKSWDIDFNYYYYFFLLFYFISVIKLF